MARRLLVTDDALIIRELIKDAAMAAGWQIAGEAGNGQEAIERYRDLDPDAVTLDLVMPHKTGEKLYWELRKDINYEKLPIMIVTGCAKTDKPRVNFRDFLEEKGIPEPNAFLEKPIDPQTTVDTAVQVLAARVQVH